MDIYRKEQGASLTEIQQGFSIHAPKQMSQEVIDTWEVKHEGPRKQGAQPLYSDTAILTVLSLRSLLSLPLRQSSGFMKSLFELMRVENLSVPDHSTLSRRGRNLQVPSGCKSDNAGPITVIIDSTGLKVYGEKEWMNHKHRGTAARKVWRKLHIAIDGKGRILASSMTTLNESDISQVKALFVGIEGPINKVLADGGYPIDEIERLAKERWPENPPEVVIPPRKDAVVRDLENPSTRDKYIERIKKDGRLKWQQETGYNQRSRVENAMYRYKRIVGGKLHSREYKRQETESQIGCLVLNNLSSLGMPKSVRIG